MARGPAEGGTGFRFRRLEKPEEFRQAEEVERQALAEDALLVVPAAVQRTFQDTGGLVLGAFADIHLAGVVAASLGWDGSVLYQQLHAVAVRPEYQNHHVGFRLLAYLRDEVLGLGLAEVRGTIDPLQSRAAHLAIRRLGGRPTGYLPDHFGRRTEGPSADPETDRLLVRWKLADPAVERAMARSDGSPEGLLTRWHGSSAVVETEPGESGLRVPRSVVEPDGRPAHLEVPFDMAALREHEPASTRRWRHAVRDAFRLVFELGYVPDEFAVLSVEHERRAFYFLSRPAETRGASAPPR